MSPEIADIIKNASPWEIQQLRAMGMFIPSHWHGKPMESFDANQAVGLRRQQKQTAQKKYRNNLKHKQPRHSTLAA